MGYRTDVPVWAKYQGVGIAPCWGSANLPESVSRDMRYRSDSITISRDIGATKRRIDPLFLPISVH